MATIRLISNLNFDIYSLPKLHREEDVHNRHNKATMEGILHPTDGSRPKVITSRTKMHTAFKVPTTFFHAWLMYLPIRTSFTPEYTHGFAFWTAQLLQIVATLYPWHAVLNMPDDILFTTHLVMGAHRLENASSTLVPAYHMSTAQVQSCSTTPLSQQICLNWNREVGCSYKDQTGRDCARKYICARCQKMDSHKSYQCTTPKNMPSASK